MPQTYQVTLDTRITIRHLPSIRGSHFHFFHFSSLAAAVRATSFRSMGFRWEDTSICQRQSFLALPQNTSGQFEGDENAKASIWTNNSNNELREVKRIFNQSKVLKWSALPLLVEYTYNSYKMCLQTTWVKLLRDLASSSGPADIGSLSQASYQSRPSSHYWPSSLTSNHSTRPRCHNCQTTSTC